MHRRALQWLSIASAALMAVFSVVSLSGAAEITPQQVVPPLYEPYPPGILPPDLRAEIARVRREIQGIFKDTLNQWRALPPPTLTGQPPTL